MLKTRDIPDVEILSVGTWHGTGCPPAGCEFTTDDLDEIADAYEKTKHQLRPPGKLGHDDNQKLLQADGYPAAGWLANVRRVGEKLLADVRQVPEKLAELIDAGAYRTRSVELEGNYEVAGVKYPMVLTGMAWLGADLPAVESLADIAALYAAKQIDLPDNARAVVFSAPEKPTRTLMTYVDNAEHVLTDVQAFIARSGELVALRAKDGRSISEKHRERLASLRDGLRDAQSKLDAFLEEAPPDEPQDYARVMRARLRIAELRAAELIGA